MNSATHTEELGVIILLRMIVSSSEVAANLFGRSKMTSAPTCVQVRGSSTSFLAPLTGQLDLMGVAFWAWDVSKIAWMLRLQPGITIPKTGWPLTLPDAECTTRRDPVKDRM